MGRRGFGHQQAHQRRGVTAPCAVRFRAAADARYRRTSVPWTLPVASVLRAPARPVRIENRVHVDARALHVAAVAREHGVLMPQRSEPKSGAIVTRLVERARRDDAQAPPSRPRDRAVAPHHERPSLVRARSATPRPLPVAMVLARPAGAAGAAVTTASVAAGDWPDANGPSRRAARADRWPQPDTTLAPVDVNRLTERVVAAIDRRMTAARERLGG